MAEKQVEEMMERMRAKEQELDTKLAAVGEKLAAMEKEANAGANSALLTQVAESSRLSSLKDTKPYLLVYEEAVKNIKKWATELKDPAAMLATEREFQANVARWTQESQMDSLASALSFYLSMEATDTDRYAMKKALASGSWSRVMVTHATTMLVHRRDGGTLLEDTMGHCLSGPIAFLHEPEVCPEIVKDVNRLIKAAQCANIVTGGGSGGHSIRAMGDCRGFGPSPFVKRIEPSTIWGGGTLPVFHQEDGTAVVDITAMENWCTRMSQYFDEAWRPLVSEVEKLKVWSERHKEAPPQELQKITRAAIAKLKTQVRKLTEEVSYRRFGRRPKSNQAWGGEVWDPMTDLGEVESFWDPLVRGTLA